MGYKYSSIRLISTMNLQVRSREPALCSILGPGISNNYLAENPEEPEAFFFVGSYPKTPSRLLRWLTRKCRFGVLTLNPKP